MIYERFHVRSAVPDQAEDDELVYLVIDSFRPV